MFAFPTVSSRSLAAALLSIASLVQAQEPASAYPSRTVTLIIGNSPGGPTDAEARLYTQKLGDNLGRSFVLDFKPGAGTAVGATYVSKSAPDGYTLIVATGGFSIPLRVQSFDPINDFTAVSLMTKRPSALFVSPALPVRNMKEYIAYAKANPGAINFGTSGPGGSIHLAGLWLHSASNSEVTFIHYKGGSQAIADLLAGRIHVYYQSLSGSLPLIRGGKVRAIGISRPERSPLLPDVGSIGEDVPGYDNQSWLGILAPAGTPAPIVNKLSAELAKAVKSPDVVKVLDAQGATPVGSSPEVFAKHLQGEVNRYKGLIKQFDIKL
jgi:tripartite-type tricarboxylate transporter receptor subunit TctC